MFVLAKNYVYNWGAAISRNANTAIGGDPAETLSSRIGKSIRDGGWAARLWWPAFARNHFVWAIDDTVGANDIWGRTERR